MQRMRQGRVSIQGFRYSLLLMILSCTVGCSSAQAVSAAADSAVTCDGPVAGKTDASPATDLLADTRVSVDNMPNGTVPDATMTDTTRDPDAVVSVDTKPRASNVTCRQSDDDGETVCQCESGTPGPTDPLCTPTSVLSGPQQQGICCSSSSSCECSAYRCVVAANNGTCVCGPSLATWVPEGTEVSDCPVPSDGQHCCLQEAMNQCACGPSSCYSGGGTAIIEVPSCSVSEITTCGLGQHSVSSCS
jgi:hypothetical protein